MNRRKRMMEDLDQDVRDFIEREIQDNIERGMRPEEARYAALRKFGNVTRVKEDTWEVWTFGCLEQLWQDIRYGLRALRKSPGFAAVAVLTLALGIGANTAIFSLVDVVLLKTLPVKNPTQLVLVQCPDGHGNHFGFSYPTYAYFRDHNSAFSGVFASEQLERLEVSVDGQPELTSGEIVSGNYYSTLGVNAIVGRTISQNDDRIAGKDAVAVISYAYWKRRFGLKNDVVGRAIAIDGAPFTIIGVTPPEFFGLMVGADPDITVPMMMEAQVIPGESLLTDRSTWWLDVGGRLQPGVSAAQAQANLDLLFQQTLVPEDRGELRIDLAPGYRGHSQFREQLSQPLFVLMAMVGLILLIACANVANLLLARAMARRKEVALRIALGAGRSRLIRQLLTESVLLAAVGGAAGLLMALWVSRFLLALVSSGPIPIFVHLPFGAEVFGFAIAVSFLTAALFGLAPAFRATRVDLTPQLKASTEGEGGGGHQFGLGKALVVSQVAFSLLLLAGATLFVRTLWNLKDLYPGFKPDHLLLFSMEPTLVGYKGARLENLYREVLERIQGYPGVHAVSISRFGELTPGRWEPRISIAGYIPRKNEQDSVQVNLVGPKFFQTMEMPLLLGRDFTSQDGETAPKVAVINEAMAHYYFGRVNPIGRDFSLSGISGHIEISGVARDAKYHSLREETPRMCFLPFLQVPPSMLERMTFEVRTAPSRGSVIAAIRRTVRSMDRNLPIFDVKTVAEQAYESLFRERLVATLSVAFALLALALASVGLYGIMAYSVARRTNEIGIRMALGAQKVQVLKLVVGQGMRLVWIGMGIGIFAALGLTRFLSSLLYGVKPTDPLALAVVSFILIGVALLACYVPARRATTIDPMVALRHE
jgi:predicted permease